MRFLLGVAAAAFLAAAPASAQTGTAAPADVGASECGALQPMPTLPDGADANRAAMDAANTAYLAWAQTYQQNLVCRHNEAEALQARADARVAEHNAAVTQLNDANTSWQAEVTEFNARGGRR